MSEINNQNRNKLLTDDVKQFIKMKKPRVRSDKQKENDIKLAEKLREYHKNKREIRNQVITSYIDDVPTEEELIKEIEKIDELIKLNEEIKEIKQEFKQEFSPTMTITKSKRGRPRKHLFPQAEEYLKACNKNA
jgi:hypothetical protein